MSQIPENTPDGRPDRPAEAGGQQAPGHQGRPGAGSFAAPAADGTPVLSEFDHLFRDSAPDTRRSVSPESSVVRFAGGLPPAPQAQGGLSPVPPQWPAPVPAQGEHAQNQPTQVSLRYDPYLTPEQVQAQYAVDELGLAIAPLDPGQPQYQQYPGQEQGQYPQQYADDQGGAYSQEPGQPQIPGQAQYDQTAYLAQAPGPTQTIDYGQQQYQAEQQGEYGGPGGYQPAGASGGGSGGGKSRRTPLLIGGAAVVVVIGLIVAMNSGGGGSAPKQPAAAGTTAPATAGQQASDLMSIVAQSGALRTQAISAVDDLSSASCAQLAADATSLQATAKSRTAQATAVAKLDVSKLPSGSEVVSDLAQAWTASATSDSAYAQIATDLASAGTTNCKAPSKKDASYATAVRADGDATRFKTAAATLWNSALATADGLDLSNINANQL
ncbi:MAG TPA: hypothetical protein VGX23_31665 [Actinocrinis sp.]|nr:hypothetical protein [Actinocrinis sp.]